MASALGESADEIHYKSLLTKLKPEWHQAFWEPGISAYSTGTQMAQAAAIWLDDLGEGHIVPPACLHWYRGWGMTASREVLQSVS